MPLCLCPSSSDTMTLIAVCCLHFFNSILILWIVFSEPVGLLCVQVYALHLVVPAGAATELIESISKSANKYGKKMQFHKPGMKEAPNPVCYGSTDAPDSVH